MQPYQSPAEAVLYTQRHHMPPPAETVLYTQRHHMPSPHINMVTHNHSGAPSLAEELYYSNNILSLRKFAEATKMEESYSLYKDKNNRMHSVNSCNVES